jgi:hypothetical protein
MSREVIGDAPTTGVAESSRRLVDVLDASRAALLPTPRVPREPGDTAPDPRTPLVAALAAVLLIVAAWAAYAVTDAPTDPARGVVAAVTGASAASSPEVVRRVLLSITVANPGREAVSVVGYAPTTRSSAATGLDRPDATVGAGERVELTVDVSLDCTRSAPLLLPDLLIQTQDGRRRAIPAVGSVAALSGLCGEGPEAAHPLSVRGVRRSDRSALVVTLVAPSNRRTEVTAVRAAGVDLDAAALPLRVDRNGAELRILPPGACPGAWEQDGIPTVLELQVESSGPTIVEVTVGKPLVEWALDIACVTP